MKFYTNVAIMGSDVLVREIVDGIPSLRKDRWFPAIYVKGQPKDPQALSVKTLYGDDAYEMLPGSIRETKDFVEQYKGVSGFDIYGQLNYSLQYMNRYQCTGWDYKKISAWSIDIETAVPVDESGKTYFPDPENADGEILLITLCNMHSGQCFTWGTKEYSGKDTHYTLCASESQLIRLFLEFWQQRRPDIITGWNICGFDLPYIINRATRIIGAESIQKLSPWGKAGTKSKQFNGQTEWDTQILGVSILDYIDLYKKYIFTKQESYSLGHIAQEELGHSKVDHSEYGSFTDFYSKAWPKFVFYNIIDTLLVKQLDDKLKLIELVLTIAYEAKINYEDVASPVKTWDAIISNYCLQQGIVLPQQRRELQSPLDGAYVKEPKPGWYKNVVSLDATSLYPSIIMTNNISPETYVGKIEDLDIESFLKKPQLDASDSVCITPVGAMYSKSQRGILPVLVEHFMTSRKQAKTEMLRLEQEIENTSDEALKNQLDQRRSAFDNKQMAIKTLLNSLYGATANQYFRFFKWEHAASITLTGQFVLRTIEKLIDAELNQLFKTGSEKYLVYIDTDSLYFSLEPVIKKFNIDDSNAIKTMERLAKDKITPIVNKICTECCDYMQSYQNKLSFKLEVAASKAVFLAKKKYVLKVFSSEGVSYTKPKFKAKGLEMVRSSTPRYVRDKLKLALDVIFDTDEKGVQQFIKSVKDEFLVLPHEQVAFPRGANNLAEYSHSQTIYDKSKSVPIQVRAALLYNHYLKKHDVDGQYPSIGEGDKLKFMYLKVPNKIRENVIAFPADGKLPQEFGLEQYIDYELQFEKTFLSAMQLILTSIGWKAEEISDLSEFF
jgi:DNA polymerase elongation subunit (family B)